MAVLIREVVSCYQWLMNDVSDHRTKHLFLIDSVPGVATIAFLYVYISWDLGPKLMRNRKPFNIKPIMRLYNFIQIIANAYILYRGFPLYWRYKLICAEVPKFGEDLSIEIEAGFIYYMLKYLDLLDTIFFILRKKNKQISFLHVSHHFAMLGCAWIALKFVPGGEVVYVVFINSIVHLLMYSYYLISTWDENSNKYIWWKRQLTHLQLIQFGILGILFFLTAISRDCNFPLVISMFVAINNVSLALMFVQYYNLAYIKKIITKI